MPDMHTTVPSDKVPPQVRPTQAAPAMPMPPSNNVTAPSHYALFPAQGIEVLHIVHQVMNRMEGSSMHDTHSRYASACFKEALTYLLRCYAKGGMEDISKAHFYLTEMLVESNQGLPEYCSHRPMPELP